MCYSHVPAACQYTQRYGVSGMSATSYAVTYGWVVNACPHAHARNTILLVVLHCLILLCFEKSLFLYNMWKRVENRLHCWIQLDAALVVYVWQNQADSSKWSCPKKLSSHGVGEHITQWVQRKSYRHICNNMFMLKPLHLDRTEEVQDVMHS